MSKKRDREIAAMVRQINKLDGPLFLPMKRVSESDEVCRHLVCPRHHRLRNPLAYCPWERANGHA